VPLSPSIVKDLVLASHLVRQLSQGVFVTDITSALKLEIV